MSNLETGLYRQVLRYSRISSTETPSLLAYGANAQSFIKKSTKGCEKNTFKSDLMLLKRQNIDSTRSLSTYARELKV